MNNIIYNIEGKEFLQIITFPSYSKAVNYFNDAEFKVLINSFNENIDFDTMDELISKMLEDNSEIKLGETTNAMAA